MEVGKLNEAISRLNFYESPGIAYTLEQKYILENKIKELEKENRRLIEDKGKIEVEFSITKDRFEELKKSNENLSQELHFTKTRHSDAISAMETRVSQMKESYDIVIIENKSCKNHEEKYKKDLMLMSIEKENLEEKVMKLRMSKDDQSKKISQLELQVKSLIMEKEMSAKEKQRFEDERRYRNEMKSQCIEQMKHNINNYRNELYRSRSKK